MKTLSLILVILFCASTFTFAQVVVIANKSVSDKEVTSNKLESIYSLEEDRWGDGATVVLFDLKSDDAVKNKFYSFFGTTAKKMKKIWLRAKLSGDGIPPKQVGSEDEMVSKVTSTEGAIGFVSKEKVTGDVKILATIN